MSKLLLLMAVILVAISSCQKPAGNDGPYTCTCEYLYVVGTYQGDTTVATTYANGTTLTIAQQYCNNTQTSLRVAHSGSGNCYLK